MSQKAALKRQLIIDQASEVFAQKGYKNVTMKDIVEACQISRGGLYLYFSSTEELLLAVLEKLEKEPSAEIELQRIQSSSTQELLLFFFKEQKREILLKKKNLLVAKYEYGFCCREEQKSNPLRKQFDTGALVLEKLLERGNARGEFYCEDPRAQAGSIMFTLEGMKITARTMGISENRVDREILYLMRQFVKED